jgi:hypothetical protein
MAAVVGAVAAVGAVPAAGVGAVQKNVSLLSVGRNVFFGLN